MKTPDSKVLKKVLGFVQDKIICPIPRIFNKHALLGKVEKFVNYFYKKSKDPAKMMIFFDSLSLITSCVAQVKSLSKSDRENKDYLIKQEISEAIVSFPLTILIPFKFTAFLERQLGSGKIMTKSTRELLDKVIKPYLGVKGPDGFYVKRKVPFGEFVQVSKNNILKKTKEVTKNNKVLKKYTSKIKLEHINPNKDVPLATLFDLLCDFDQAVFDKLEAANKTNMYDLPFFKSPEVMDTLRKTNGLYKNSAVAHVKGEIDGIKILSIILLNIIAGNVIMPIFKNKFSNRMQQKELAARGETKESILRKKRYGNLKTISNDYGDENNVFSVFSNSDNTLSSHPKQIKPDKELYSKLIVSKSENNVFKEIPTFSSNSTQSDRLRI